MCIVISKCEAQYRNEDEQVELCFYDHTIEDQQLYEQHYDYDYDYDCEMNLLRQIELRHVKLTNRTITCLHLRLDLIIHILTVLFIM